MRYYSEEEQDKFIDLLLFNKQQNGFFVDIGAFNGVAGSNTYFFERYRNWTGICVEPNPRIYETLKKVRQCLTVNACISDMDGEEYFLDIKGRLSMLSGIVRTFSSEHNKRIERELIEFSVPSEKIKVPSFSFNTFIKKFDIKHIDYCSIDTEGSEQTIIKCIDFSTVSISVISVENTYSNKHIPDCLTSNGYKLVSVLGDDQIYVHDKK